MLIESAVYAVEAFIGVQVYAKCLDETCERALAKMGKKGKAPKGRAGAKQKAQKGTPNKRSSTGGGSSSNAFLSRQMLDEGMMWRASHEAVSVAPSSAKHLQMKTLSNSKVSLRVVVPSHRKIHQ